MADEITVSASLQSAVNRLSRSAVSLSVDQDAVGKWDVLVNVGITEEAITPAEITTEGWCLLVNTDDTNFITYGPEDTGAMIPFGIMEPGEPAIFRWSPGMVLRAEADTAACEMAVVLLED